MQDTARIGVKDRRWILKEKQAKGDEDYEKIEQGKERTGNIDMKMRNKTETDRTDKGD